MKPIVEKTMKPSITRSSKPTRQASSSKPSTSTTGNFDSVNQVPSEMPSETTHPSISPKGPPKEECKKETKIKVPKRCKGGDRDPDDLIYLPRKTSKSDVNVDNVSQCRSAYVESKFSLFDTSNYDQWYAAESIMLVSDLGMFRGYNEIAQYANFLQNKDILDKFELIKSSVTNSSSPFLDIIADGDECVLTVAFVASVATNTIFSNDPSVTMDVIVGLRTKFSILDETNILVHRNDLVSNVIACVHFELRLIVLSPTTPSYTCS